MEIFVNVVRVGGGAHHIVLQVTVNRDWGVPFGDFLFQVYSDGLEQAI